MREARMALDYNLSGRVDLIVQFFSYLIDCALIWICSQLRSQIAAE